MFEGNDEAEDFFAKNVPVGASSLEDLRDTALNLFDDYLAQRLNAKRTNLPEDTIEYRRQFLSLDEAEQIVKEFSAAKAGTPEGVYCVRAKSVEELQQHMKELLHALMSRVMSNLVHKGVNMGFIDCSYDDEVGAFAFAPSELGIKKLDELHKNRKKKKKKNDSDD